MKKNFLLVDIVSEFIVASKGNQCSQTETIRKKYLSNSINPHFGLTKFCQVRCDIELYSFHGSR